MSTFKLKPEKIRRLSEVKTLDETHRKYVEEFQKQKKLLPKKKKKLQILQNKLNKINSKPKDQCTNDDYDLKFELKRNIKNLSDEINDIESNRMEIDYYCKIDDILTNYYNLMDTDGEHIYSVNPELSKEKKQSENKKKMDRLDKLNLLSKKKKKTKKVTRKRKYRAIDDKRRNIFSYINPSKNDESKKNKKNKKNRAELFEQYKIRIDSDYASKKNKSKNIIKKCENCNIDKTLIHSEGMYVCENCGDAEQILVDSEKPNYKDCQVPVKPAYPYKKINHYNEFLNVPSFIKCN